MQRLLQQVQQHSSSSRQQLVMLLRSGGLQLLLRCMPAACWWAACWAQAAWLRRSAPWQQQAHSCWQRWEDCCEAQQ
jgi:hypothetical protein